MALNLVILLFCIVICSHGEEFDPILLQIASGNSECNSEKFFKNFELTDVPQFGAMCDIPSPRWTQVDYLLDSNTVPILCMGLYDVSIRLCKTAKNDKSTSFAELFPPSVEKFLVLFKRLNVEDEYSNLDKFCSIKVKNYTLEEPSSNITTKWWGLLNSLLTDESGCKRVCRSKENKVHPLCSYIIWSNGVYLNYLKNQAESHITSVGEDQINIPEDDTNPINDPVKLVPSDVGISNVPAQPFISSEVTVSDGSSSLLQLPMMPSAVLVQNRNTSSLQVETAPEQSKDTAPELSKDSIIVDTPLVDKHTDLTKEKLSAVWANKTRVVPPSADDKTPIKNNKTKKKPLEAKTAGENPEKKPKASVMENTKNDGGASAPALNELPSPVLVDQSKVKIGAEDFSFETTSEGAVQEQPVGDDKYMQPAYPGDEMEDGDDDDVGIEPERPVKAAPNKTGAGKTSPSKPGAAANEQGMAEPDKMYQSEVDREIIIEDHFIEAEDSHFFTYFLCMSALTILAYLAFHNKKKLLALAVEGRRTRGTRRRPNSSNYSKLDCSLEEAMVSNTTASVTHVLY